MMKNIIFYSSLVCLLNLNSLKAQCNFNIDSIISDKLYHDYGLKVIQDYQGNYVSCGNIYDLNTFSAGYLVKAKYNGDTIWRKKFDFTTNSDIFNDIKELPDKSYIVLGTSSSTVGISHVFIANIDTSGTLMWYKQFTYSEYETAKQLQITSDNKLVILGYSKVYTQNTGDILVIKTDISGNLIWRKIIGSSTLDENYNSLQIIDNNSTYLIGGTERPAGKYNIAVTKLDTSGTVIWNKLNGNSSQDYYGNSICQTFDKGYLVGGKANTQGRLWKLDSTGTVQWSNNYGLNIFTIIKEVKQLSDSNFVYTTNDNYLHSSSNTVKAGILAKIDRSGSLIWEKFYRRPSIGSQVVGVNGFSITGDNGFIITGSETNVSGSPYTNTWLIKTDSLGNDSSTCLIYNALNDIDKLAANIQLYPNPNSGNFNILIKNLRNNQDIINIAIYDILGQAICYKKLDPSEAEVEIGAEILTDGIYFVKLTQNNSDIWQSKFIIKN